MSRTILHPVRRAVAAVALCALGAWVASCSQDRSEHRAYIESLMRHRTGIDALMASKDGPLTATQRGRFKGLAFFTPRTDLIFEVALQRADIPDTVAFITSKNTVDRYTRLGVLRFDFEGRTHELTLFRALHDGHLFLPFTDRTSGDKTYGAGRYLDAQPLADGRFRLDFNRAYNPYCAYNATWVCPLPPPENALDIAVEAGERNFPYKDG